MTTTNRHRPRLTAIHNWRIIRLRHRTNGTENGSPYSKREKEVMKLQDELSEQQRALPWVKVDKDYIFTTTDGESR
jgi:predicted dithiol-disulfide oxidoreductase (DUF899 family)